jgi:pimeloyl-ACP methyl ester carboxylesterase
MIKRVIMVKAIKPQPAYIRIPTLTVWIHGTSFTWWRHCPFGLTPAHALPDGSRLQTFAHKLAANYPTSYAIDTFYAFGWSGKLCFKERERAAEDLYRLLRKEITYYEQTHLITPRVRLISHSHGGNVALNLAKIKPEQDQRFCVDELILLACPVQKATAEYMDDPLFKKIYALYSRSDWGQILDPQGLYPNVTEQRHPVSRKKHASCPLLSGRVFKPQSKLLQGRLRIDGAGAYHVEFSDAHVVTILPTLIESLDSCKKEADERFGTHESVIFSLRVKRS